MNAAIITGILFCTMSALCAEPSSKTLSDGKWKASEVSGLSNVQLEIDSPQKKVRIELNPGNQTTPKSIGVVFTNPKGQHTTVELKTMDATQMPIRYEGNLSNASSFVGFEIKIPFPKKKPIAIDSRNMVRVLN